ncbi:Hypothetical protein ACI5QL_01883 [Bacillus velezensis]
MNEEYTYAVDSDMRPFGRPGFGFGRPGFGFGRPGFGFGFGRPGFGFGRPWFGYGFGRPFGFYGGPFFGGLVGGLSEALYSIRTCTGVTATAIRISIDESKRLLPGPFCIGLMS